ncbi:hypothetical protein MJO28_014814 [Puccinia striiformis f. sp. tritici]|uniref:Uncharacterized protein n=1 Tax=Puccinia striiformis f. sp. tritici TaxID=168172 RepID=A0ACC0DQR6_9BASI|nr:hypothetical protein MJO28_014814 [Puccinia striiformis f. sp. tritici]
MNITWGNRVRYIAKTQFVVLYLTKSHTSDQRTTIDHLAELWLLQAIGQRKFSLRVEYKLIPIIQSEAPNQFVAQSRV